MLGPVLRFNYLDNFDDQAEGEWHSEKDEEDRDEDQEVGAQSLPFLAGCQDKNDLKV